METEKNIQVEPGFELPQNSSVLDSSEMTRHFLSKYPELQFTISQLASLVMPVAPLSKLEDNNYVSVDVRNHLDYNNPSFNNEVELKTNTIFLNCIFNDWDHGSSENDVSMNMENGVFYDFHIGDLDRKGPAGSPKNYGYKSEELKVNVLAKLKQKVQYFRSQIADSSGLVFLNSLIKKTADGDKVHPDPLKIQNLLLLRCDRVLKVLI